MVADFAISTLPAWLTETHAVSLDLEASYEETCRDLRIAWHSGHESRPTAIGGIHCHDESSRNCKERRTTMTKQEHLAATDRQAITRRWFFKECGVGLGTVALHTLL